MADKKQEAFIPPGMERRTIEIYATQEEFDLINTCLTPLMRSAILLSLCPSKYNPAPWADSGISWESLLADLRELKPGEHNFITTDTLNYLRKSTKSLAEVLGSQYSIQHVTPESILVTHL